jgi:hypothetical protein
MQLMERSATVTLEVLDARHHAISTVAATLHYLDGELATLDMAADGGTVGLHWGARVRFWVGTGAQGFEIIGAVVGCGLSDGDESDEEADEPRREICVRLFECRPAPQRRSSPRRRIRLPISFAVLAGDDPELLAETADAPAMPAAPEYPCAYEWRDATLIDLGCGGVRMRIDGISSAPSRVLIRLTLPAYEHVAGAVPARTFELPGEVLRAEPSRRRAGSLVIAAKFLRIDPQEAIAISGFVESGR